MRWHHFRRFIRLFVFLALTASLQAQSSQRTLADWSARSRRAAEDTVAQKIEAIRASAKLSPLIRATPSLGEIELVCTAAVTGKKVGDPKFGALYTYVTADLSAEVEAVKTVALGTEACLEGPGNPTCRGGEPRHLFYPTKTWPRYSVVVELNPSSTPGNVTYTVGVARRASALKEFLAPLFSDVPFKGMNEWKKEVAPECRSRKD